MVECKRRALVGNFIAVYGEFVVVVCNLQGLGKVSHIADILQNLTLALSLAL
jgi:hypothetical protein